jgi:hypothetical protein
VRVGVKGDVSSKPDDAVYKASFKKINQTCFRTSLNTVISDGAPTLIGGPQ